MLTHIARSNVYSRICSQIILCRRLIYLTQLKQIHQWFSILLQNQHTWALDLSCHYNEIKTKSRRFKCLFGDNRSVTIRLVNLIFFKLIFTQLHLVTKYLQRNLFNSTGGFHGNNIPSNLTTSKIILCQWFYTNGLHLRTMKNGNGNLQAQVIPDC